MKFMSKAGSRDKIKKAGQGFLASLLTAAMLVSLGSVVGVNKKAKADTVIPSNMVNNCEPYNYSGAEFNAELSMGGSIYSDAIYFNKYNYDAYIDFNFNGAYKSMSFWFGQINGEAHDAKLEIEADGVKVKEQTIIANAVPVKIEVDLTNVYQLKIRRIMDQWYNYSGHGMGGINLVSNGVVRDVKLDKSELSLSTANPSAYVKSIIVPIDATDQSVVWSSSNPDVAAVDATGLVTGVAGGEATITATTGTGGYTASCKVKVDMPYDFTKAELSYKDGEISVTYNGESLSSYDDYSLEVSNNAKKGIAIIKAIGKGSYSGEKSITVKLNKTKIKKCKRNSGRYVTVKIKPQRNISGIEYQISKNIKFKGKKSTHVESASVTAATTNVLPKNKRFYVRVRTYTYINDVKCYGAWSEVKSVKTNKQKPRSDRYSFTWKW